MATDISSLIWQPGSGKKGLQNGANKGNVSSASRNGENTELQGPIEDAQ